MPKLREKLAARAKTTRAAEKPKGIRITPADPKTAPARLPERPEPRELGRTEGEDILFENPPSTEPSASWHEAVTALDTDLGIWVEPSGEHAWVAVESRNGQPRLILLQRLPLLINRNENEPY